MKGELVRVSTPDGLELQGFLAAAGDASRAAVLHIHGLAGNFYENRFIDHLCRAVVNKGVHFLSANTRGHDYLSDIIFTDVESGETSFRQIGATYELFEDCVLDIDAWTCFLRSIGCGEIILQGHSCGAIKVAHYASLTDSPEVAGLVLLSPWDSVGTMTHELGPKLDDGLKIASTMAVEGREMELMPREYFVYPISARTYLDFFRADSPLGLFDLSSSRRAGPGGLESVRVPVLAVVGTVDEAFLGESDCFLSSLRQVLTNTAAFTGEILTGAPHSYLGFEKELAEIVGDWVGTWFGAKGNG